MEVLSAPRVPYNSDSSKALHPLSPTALPKVALLRFPFREATRISPNLNILRPQSPSHLQLVDDLRLTPSKETLCHSAASIATASLRAMADDHPLHSRMRTCEPNPVRRWQMMPTTMVDHPKADLQVEVASSKVDVDVAATMQTSTLTNLWVTLPRPVSGAPTRAEAA